jgi:hypothetical protein
MAAKSITPSVYKVTPEKGIPPPDILRFSYLSMLPKAFVGTVLDAGHALSFRGIVVSKLIGDHHA